MLGELEHHELMHSVRKLSKLRIVPRHAYPSTIVLPPPTKHMESSSLLSHTDTRSPCTRLLLPIDVLHIINIEDSQRWSQIRTRNTHSDILKSLQAGTILHRQLCQLQRLS